MRGVGVYRLVCSRCDTYGWFSEPIDNLTCHRGRVYPLLYGTNMKGNEIPERKSFHKHSLRTKKGRRR